MTLPRTSLNIVEVQIAWMAISEMVDMLERRAVRDADVPGMAVLRSDAKKLRDRLGKRLAAFKTSVVSR